MSSAIAHFARLTKNYFSMCAPVLRLPALRPLASKCAHGLML